MNQRTRILLAIGAIILITVIVLGVDYLQRQSAVNPTVTGTPLPPGAIPIYVGGELSNGFTPDDIQNLEKASFVDAEEGKTQEGWRLEDVLLLYLDPELLEADATVVVSSSSRGKSAELTWAEIQDPENHVMFDISGRGTLKLVSTLPRLDVRDEWIQDVDRIEVETP